MEKGRVIVPPGRTGEPFTGQSGTGDQIVGSHEVRKMRKSHTGGAIPTVAAAYTLCYH